MKAPPNFRKLLDSATHRHDTRTVFDAFVKLAACALSLETREAEYMEEIKRWEKPELELFSKALGALTLEMQDRPYEDLLGGYYMEYALSKRGQGWNGEFHTPKTICDVMAQMTIGDRSHLPAEGPITICEPACGAGAMILSVAQVFPPEDRRRLRVTATDICRAACDMCYINTTLWGIPTRVIHGNTISLECWSSWDNIHWIMPWLPLAMRPLTDKEEPEPTSAPALAMLPVPTFQEQPATITLGQLQLI